MNMIMCSENCKHQCDGYCCLVECGNVSDSDSNNSGCCYFEEKTATPNLTVRTALYDKN